MTMVQPSIECGFHPRWAMTMAQPFILNAGFTRVGP